MADDHLIELQHVTSPAAFWEQFAHVMGSPDGLLTYRYLDCLQDPETLEGHMDLRHDMRNATGGIMAAPLAIAIAEGRGDDDAVPAPVMTSVHIVDAGHGVRSLLSYPLDGPSHSGRTLSFGAGGMLVDADDRERIIAFTQGLGVKLGPAPEGYVYVPPAPSGVVDSPDLPPLHDAFGVTRNAAGDLELPLLTQQLASTSGTLHHGPTQVILEALALELATEHAGTDLLQIEDWTVFYTAAGKVGPFVARGSIIGAGNAHPDRYGARVHLCDAGRGDRLIAMGTGFFRRVG